MTDSFAFTESYSSLTYACKHGPQADSAIAFSLTLECGMEDTSGFLENLYLV